MNNHQNTIFVGEDIYSKIEQSSGKYYGKYLYIAGVKIKLDSLLKPNQMLTLDPYLKKALKAMEEVYE